MYLQAISNIFLEECLMLNANRYSVQVLNVCSCSPFNCCDESGSALVLDHILLKTENLLNRCTFLFDLC